MALDPTILSVRRYDLLDMAAGYDGEPEDEYEAADLTSNKDDLKDDWAALIQAIQTANNAETDPAVWIAALETLKTDGATAVNARINDTYTIIKSDVLIQCAEDLKTVTVVAFPAIDGRCNGNGRYSLKQDTGLDEDEDTLIRCKTCDGRGYGADADEVKANVTYPEKTPSLL